MKTLKSIALILCMMTGLSIISQGAKTSKNTIVTEEVTYEVNGVTMKSLVAYNSAIKGKRPAIVVVPEWWGNNDYSKKRAKMLAELGYIAIATDMYGEGKIADNPKTAQELATPFYQNPKMGQEKIEAAITKLKTYSQTDATKIGAIGYCFGGSMVLNAIKLGTTLNGVVSFHGGLQTAPATKGTVKGKILVCHGLADKFVPQTDIDNFKKNLDDAGVSYTFINYENATHAFTNPESTANGKKFSMPIAYNEAADKKSWADMKVFFKTIF